MNVNKEVVKRVMPINRLDQDDGIHLSAFFIFLSVVAVASICRISSRSEGQEANTTRISAEKSNSAIDCFQQTFAEFYVTIEMK